MPRLQACSGPPPDLLCPAAPSFLSSLPPSRSSIQPVRHSQKVARIRSFLFSVRQIFLSNMSPLLIKVLISAPKRCEAGVAVYIGPYLMPALSRPPNNCPPKTEVQLHFLFAQATDQEDSTCEELNTILEIQFSSQSTEEWNILDLLTLTSMTVSCSGTFSARLSK